MKICPNAYYNYRKKRKAFYHQRKEEAKQTIREIYHEYEGRPGYRMMKVFLERQKIFLSQNTVLRYMQELEIHSIRRPRKPRYHKGEQYKNLIIS